jgi:hypothetical protein
MHVCVFELVRSFLSVHFLLLFFTFISFCPEDATTRRARRLQKIKPLCASSVFF